MTVEVLAHRRCRACRRNPIEMEIDDDAPQEPYRVCRGCGDRLRRRALRPIEWFNLAAVHGWSSFLLHDDFYDQDGSASQPEASDYTTDGMEAPTLEMCAGSLDRLIDYCITRWRIEPTDFVAFGRFATNDILAGIQERAETGNRHILKTTLELSANVIGSPAAPWVRAQFERASHDSVLFTWAEAAARCLPRPEGLHMTFDALKPLRGRDLQNGMAALSWFRSAEVLDWIEANAPSANVSDSWGRLASLSDLDWTRAQDWLAKGRPHSLVALDALASYIPHRGHAPILKRINPALKGGVDRTAIERTLQSYASDDDAPRVVARCKFIISNLDKLHVQ